MNRILSIAFAAVVLVGLSGCQLGRGTCGGCGGDCFDCQADCCESGCSSCNECSSCGEDDCCDSCKKGLLGHHGRGHGLHGRRGPYNAGPPSAAITYPYYTTRGPRDFLARDPLSIGP